MQQNPIKSFPALDIAHVDKKLYLKKVAKVGKSVILCKFLFKQG
jgi:hypothetical protein